MKASEKKSFKIYKEWQRQFSALDNETAGELIKAVFAYQTAGEKPEKMSPVAEMAFSFICQQFERDNEAYEEISRVRSEAGKKGGAPRGNSNAAKKNAATVKDDDESKKTSVKAKTNKNKQNKPEEEEEDKEEEEEDASSSDGDDEKYCESNGKNDSDFAEDLPSLILKDGEKHFVTRERYERYRTLYPNVDVSGQIRCMAGWLEANPDRRKKKSGIERFIAGWLVREQNKISENGGTAKTNPSDGKNGDFVLPDKLRQAGFDLSIDEFLE